MRGSMPVPLTHHRIMTLVGPFARRGRHVDLAVTDRLAGRLSFQIREHKESAGRLPDFREHLVLETDTGDRLRLVRRLECDAGINASLEIEGTDPEVLLSILERQSIADGFSAGTDWLIAWQQKIPFFSPPAVPGVSPQLIEAHARVAGLQLHLRMSGISSVPADLLLEQDQDDPLRLPDDFFAVLGWNWGTRLRRTALGWTTTVMVRGRGPGRHRCAMQQFERAVQHLACAMAEPPALFHQRCARARWWVAGRRAAPLAFSVMLMGLTFLLPGMHIAADSSLRMLIFNAPPLLLVLAFSLRELPSMELPRRPRPSPLTAWRNPLS